MSQEYCTGCGTVLRVKPENPGICPHCGGQIAPGRHSNRSVDPPPEPEPVRYERKTNTRFLGGIQLMAGVIFIAILAPGVGVAMFAAGLVAAHGLFRLIFGSGPDRGDDED